MSKSRDTLGLGPHWHVDCRLEAELPEDNVVGTRFLINALFGSVALALMLVTGWLAYQNISVRHQINDWERRISDSRGEVGEIHRLQGEYLTEAKKIDSAYALMKTSLFTSAFMARLGETLPSQMAIDSIETNENSILVRGSINDTLDSASNLFSGYLGLLRKDPAISPFFDKITQTDFQRTGDNVITFVVTFQRKPPPP
jgi:Tfp pilus assembly protein PilN